MLCACDASRLDDPLARDRVITRLTPLALKNDRAVFAYPYADDERVHVAIRACEACIEGDVLIELDPRPSRHMLQVGLDRRWFDGRDITIAATRGDDERAYLTARLHAHTLEGFLQPEEIAFLDDGATIYPLPYVAPLPAGFYTVSIRNNRAVELYCTEGCRVTDANQVALEHGKPTLFVIDVEDEKAPRLYGAYALTQGLEE